MISAAATLSPTPSNPAKSTTVPSMDTYYSFPEDKVQEIRNKKPWMADAKHFKRVKVSPSACIKMLTHGQSGVEKGISQSGKPVEVMGLLLGRPDTEDLQSMIITEALPMPCEGFETRVIVDDENVINYMIEMGESIEMTRPERFCGWYHTHPFDLDGTSHCYLSNTDVQTQLQWQRAEDRHGNHWLAIVIDPLLSIAQGKPEMMAFRVFPPEYAGAKDECPDGKIVKEERERVSLWGACWNRYYRLEIEYFMSKLAQDTLGIMRTQLLWSKGFTAAEISAHTGSAACNEPGKANTKVIQQMTQRLEDLSHRRGGGGGSGIGSRFRLGGAGGSAAAIDSACEEEFVSHTSELKGLEDCATKSRTAVTNYHSCAICSLMLKQAVFCIGSDTSSSSLSPQRSSAAEEVVALNRLLIQQRQRPNESDGPEVDTAMVEDR